VALADAIDTLLKRRAIAANPLHGQVAAVSVGIYRGTPVLDLDYAEDSNAETDMNVVMNSGGGFVEVPPVTRASCVSSARCCRICPSSSTGSGNWG
jgi:ribonuclease PH